MHYDVTCCVTCISNNVEYREKGVTKILSNRLHCHFAMQLKKRSTKLFCTSTLKSKIVRLSKICSSADSGQ